ncbi:DUF3369 domain-containing protein [Marinobacterium arenosum]|uniref:DUF3369 domain-containing protein n=1 Tax=Marinobacterium arenosum TaxID=2862496 RepID=UPI001C98A859|nr:DUF3369 domain-containing protein [Marinobacterium arenosum]MBY4677434.1 DUF3369 domain-containing protein [Marinobacterium arenosum]
MMTNNAADQLLFGNNSESEIDQPEKPFKKWKILIVDDEEGIHAVTEMALSRVRFDGSGLQFLKAYSGQEARRVLAEHEDIAVVLLDVVMETDDAGLQVADYIRYELGNHSTRIILRTGQPGQAPEEKVVERYDINDYKEKTELTYRKLYSAVYTALRSYRDIVALERNRAGLEKVVNATTSILQESSMQSLAQGVLEQLAALLYMDQPMLLAEYEGVVAEKDDDGISILAHTSQGNKEHSIEYDFGIRAQIQQALESKTDVVDKDYCVRYIANKNGVETVLYMAGKQPLAISDQRLLDLYCRNVAVAFENVRLNSNLRETQKEIVYALCELAETRSRETGNHVRRVAYYSRLMAQSLGLDRLQCDQVFLAAPLHDVGKIGIPDAVLNKPGKLSGDEWTLMKTHTTIGAQIMKRSRQPVLQAGAIIAEQHHENWDGSGYPHGLVGEQIHIFGRIVALADVFDALASKRCYKDAWALEQIDNFIFEQSGVKFDPALVEIYRARRQAFIDILERFRDRPNAAKQVV